VLSIVHVCRSAPPRRGGMEAAVGGLARAQLQRGHEVRIVSLHDPPHEGRAGGVEVVRLARAGPRRYPLAVGLAAATRGADVVHVHGIDGLLDQLAWSRRAPLGVSTHGGYFHTPRDRALKAAWLRTITRLSLSRADRVWFGSEQDRERFAPAQVRGRVVPFGIGDRPPVARDPEPGLLVALGRVDVHKGLDDLIDALPAGVRLEVVGPEHRPGLVAALRERARRVGARVDFVGEVDDDGWRAALSRADRVVLPSRYEGMGLAALEVLAAGVPLVCSDIPAFRPWREAAHLVSFRAPGAGEALLAPISPERVARGRALAAPYRWSERIVAWEAEYGALLAAAR
jgi:alpha-1,3-mannosyltransferase